MPFALTKFCCNLTLQVGMVILSVVFFTLAGVILAANLFDRHDSVGIVLMIFLLLGFIVAGILMMISSKNYSRPIALAALAVIVLVTCFWLTLSLLSFHSEPSVVRSICIGSRCPESFWIASLTYRTQRQPRVGRSGERIKYVTRPTKRPSLHNFTIERTEEVPTTLPPTHRPPEPDNFFGDDKSLRSAGNRPVNSSGSRESKDAENSALRKYEINYAKEAYYTTADKSPAPQKNQIVLPKNSKLSFLHSSNNFSIEYSEEEPDYTESEIFFGEGFAGAVFLFLVNLVYLLFSVLVAWSWAVELSLPVDD